MASFSVNCPFLFPNFAPTWWKKLGSQAATSSSIERWQQLVPKKPDKYWQKFFLDFFLIAQSKDCFGLAFG